LAEEGWRVQERVSFPFLPLRRGGGRGFGDFPPPGFLTVVKNTLCGPAQAGKKRERKRVGRFRGVTGVQRAGAPGSQGGFSMGKLWGCPDKTVVMGEPRGGLCRVHKGAGEGVLPGPDGSIGGIREATTNFMPRIGWTPTQWGALGPMPGGTRGGDP